MEGLPPKKFLQLNYDKREKLEDFADNISIFFERMEHYDKRSLDFFNKEYEWFCKNWGDGTYWTMTSTGMTLTMTLTVIRNLLEIIQSFLIRNFSKIIQSVCKFT